MKLPISLKADYKTGCLRKNIYEISLKIHVLPIKGLSDEVIENISTSAVIAISSVPERLGRVGLYNWCALSFADVENPDMKDAFTINHATLIKNFILELPSILTDLYICCDSGESRSPAIAAVLLILSGRSDDCVWNNPFYKPNLLVYRVMCKAFGIIITEEELFAKKQQNEQALSNAIESADVHNFKRWEIYD